jgi:hypothetical protein
MNTPQFLLRHGWRRHGIRRLGASSQLPGQMAQKYLLFLSGQRNLHLSTFARTPCPGLIAHCPGLIAPRQRNPTPLHSGYALSDPVARWVEFRRAAYDIAKARRKIGRSGLHRYAAQRLSLGRLLIQDARSVGLIAPPLKPRWRN